METIINYMLGLNDVRRFSIGAQAGDHWIGVTDRGGVITVLCAPMDDDERECVQFTDKLEALEYIQNYMKEVNNHA